MCDKPGITREHVPPRCLFPEAKDVQGNYRKQLITVPSCNIHNTSKSSDDEFLLVCLAGIGGNNSIGYAHKLTKVNRSIRNSSFRLLDEALKNRKKGILKVGPNKFTDVNRGTPNYERLFRCFDHIARALYYHTFSERFVGQTKPLLGFLLHAEETPREFSRFIKDKVAFELLGKPRLGENPDIFTYQFTAPDQFGLFLVHLQFYGGVDVYVGLIPESIKPPENLAILLINEGIQTEIKDGGKSYFFNRRKD